MKRFALWAAGLTFAVAVACYIVPDVAFAAHSHGAGLLGAGDLFMANAALLALRTQHGELTRSAAAKRAEIVDGLAAEKVRAIEAEHAELVRQVEAVQAEITAAERAAPPAAAPAPVDAAAAAQAAVTAERSRVADITALCEQFGLRELLTGPQGLIVTGRSVEQARETILAKLAERSAQNPQRPQITMLRDAGDTIRRAVGAALVLRANPNALPAAAREERELAHSWRGMRLMEMGRAFLEETTGRKFRGLSPHELAGALLGLDTLNGRAAGMQSTSDFAIILANTASRRLRDAYAAAPQTFKLWARQSNNPDFKAKSVTQLSAAPAFKKVREGQEYSHGGMADSGESYALSTFGRIIAISRQTLINDDLGAFDRLPMLIGRAAADLESTTVYDILLTNAAMSDNIALFHNSHGNLMSGTAIDETNLAIADKKIRDQRGFGKKDEDREYLNLVPKFLLTGTEYRVPAQKILTAVSPSATSEVNPFQGAMQPVTEQRVTGKKWFVIADPATIDTVEYAYLDGEEGVQVEERVGFEVDGIEIKGRVDFAAKAIDWRGMAYNPGAGG
jgi:hypothetical protein